MSDFIWDENRRQRTGIAESIFCLEKTAEQINAILDFHSGLDATVMMTRLSSDVYEQLSADHRQKIHFYDDCGVAFYNQKKPQKNLRAGIGIVTAGTSDLNIAKEASATLRFNHFDAPIIADVGVAGISRLLDRQEVLSSYKVLIAIAGMEGALFSVLAGLVKAPIIAVPSSVGYGVSSGGKAALNSALASCAPGVVVVNIDNGFGAAVAAIKILLACDL